MAYTFSNLKIVVVESLQYGNALYVFGDDWNKVSGLTKAEVINQNLMIARIPHFKGWQESLSVLFSIEANEAA